VDFRRLRPGHGSVTKPIDSSCKYHQSAALRFVLGYGTNSFSRSYSYLLDHPVSSSSPWQWNIKLNSFIMIDIQQKFRTTALLLVPLYDISRLLSDSNATQGEEIPTMSTKLVILANRFLATSQVVIVLEYD
jgi:hypothetical protein